MGKTPERVGDSQIRRKAKLLAPRAWKAANISGRKLYGSGFNQAWNDTNNSELYVKARKTGWIAGIEYALTEFQKQRLSPRATKTNVAKRKRK